MPSPKTLIFTPSDPIRWSWVTIAGPDAADFLQRLTTVNVRALEEGAGADGFFLTEKGRILTAFTLWRYGPEDFAFELDAGASGRWKTALLEIIDRYTFAERFTLSDLTASPRESLTLEPRWIFMEPGTTAEQMTAILGAGAEGLAPMRTAALDEEIRVCHHGSARFGRPWLSVWGRGARLMQWMDRVFEGAEAADFGKLELWRVENLKPRVDQEIEPDTVLPVEVNLQNGIAQAKGCYPGQEVIEKIFSYGSPPRRLVRVRGKGALPSAGSALLNRADPPAEIGRITTAVVSAESPELKDSWSALAIVRKMNAKEGLAVSGAGFEGEIDRVAPYEHASSESAHGSARESESYGENT